MTKIPFLGTVIIMFAVYLLFVQRWDQATAFAVTIIMIAKLEEER